MPCNIENITYIENMIFKVLVLFFFSLAIGAEQTQSAQERFRKLPGACDIVLPVTDPIRSLPPRFHDEKKASQVFDLLNQQLQEAVNCVCALAQKIATVSIAAHSGLMLPTIVIPKEKFDELCRNACKVKQEHSLMLRGNANICLIQKQKCTFDEHVVDVLRNIARLCNYSKDNIPSPLIKYDSVKSVTTSESAFMPQKLNRDDI